MSKKQKSIIMIYVILFVLYNMLFLMIPFKKIASSWTALIFSWIAIVVSLMVTFLAFRGGKKLPASGIYGYPIFRIGYLYAIIQILFSVLVCVLGCFFSVPIWIVVVISTILIGCAAIGIIATDNARDVIEEQEIESKKKISSMVIFRLSMESIADRCTDEELKTKLVKLVEKFKYSDPVSNEMLVEIEEELKENIAELKNTIEVDRQVTFAKVEMIENLLDYRNRLCKETK
ncbi:MAG: hypothetical protein ACI4SE_02990 [Lachnospiraceae bacterium]